MTRLVIAAAVLTLLTACPLGGPANKRSAGTGTATQVTTAKPASKSAAASTPKPAADTTEADFQRALQLMQSRDYASAEPLLAGLTQRQPRLAGPWLNLGIVYARTNRRPEALRALRQGLSLNPRSAVAQNQLGILLRESGDLRAAEQAYQAALAATPGYAYAHLNLGVLYDVHLRQPALALKHYEQYRSLAPADSARVAVWIADLKQRTSARP